MTRHQLEYEKPNCHTLVISEVSREVTRIVYSYARCVAIIDTRATYKTAENFSRSTSRHVREALRGLTPPLVVPQWWIEDRKRLSETPKERLQNARDQGFPAADEEEEYRERYRPRLRTEAYSPDDPCSDPDCPMCQRERNDGKDSDVNL